MEKSPDAFRTISEVADLLDVPAHVLRFWESRFPQVRPVKRAGGRRYYRPTDVALLGGIRLLLHDQGLTIRGVQKILREQGVRHVCALADQGLALDARQEWVEEEAIGLPVAPVVEDRVIPWPGPRKMSEEAELADQPDEAADTVLAEAVAPMPEAAGNELEDADAALQAAVGPPDAVTDDTGQEETSPLPSPEPGDDADAPPTEASGMVAEPAPQAAMVQDDDPATPGEADATEAELIDAAAAPERHPFEGLPLFMQPPAPVPASERAVLRGDIFRPTEETLPDLPALAARLRGLSPAPADLPRLRDIANRLRQLRDRVDQGQPGRE